MHSLKFSILNIPSKKGRSCENKKQNKKTTILFIELVFYA